MNSLQLARSSGFARFLVPVLALGLATPTIAQLPVTSIVSIDGSGPTLPTSSVSPEISSDGRYVVFQTGAKFDPADTSDWDIYIKDMQTGALELISVSSAGVKGNAASSAPSISNDGNIVSFHSKSTNLVPGNSGFVDDVYVRNRALQTTVRVSKSLTGAGGSGQSYLSRVSGSGQFVVFNSLATDLVVVDTNNQMDVFIADLKLGSLEIASVDSAGQLMSHQSSWGNCSMNGRYVTFQSQSPDLVPGDSNGEYDIFVRDRLLGTTERVSVTETGGQSNKSSSYASISDDGSLVVFSTSYGLVAEDTNSASDIYCRHLLTGAVERISVDSLEEQSNGYSIGGLISPSGNFVTFSSDATNLVPGDLNGKKDIFLRDLQAGTTERVNVSSASQEGDNWSSEGSCSSDGRLVCYESYAGNLAAFDSNDLPDIFLFDRRTGGSSLTVSNFVAGQVAMLQGAGLTPGAAVLVGFTLSGQSSFGSPFGIFHLSPPFVLVPLIADGAGDLARPISLPAALLGTSVFAEGLDLVSGLRTPILAETVL